jgi:hypothetical protein
MHTHPVCQGNKLPELAREKTRYSEVSRRITNRRKMYLASKTHLLFCLNRYQRERETEREREGQATPPMQ